MEKKTKPKFRLQLLKIPRLVVEGRKQVQKELMLTWEIPREKVQLKGKSENL